MDKMQRITVVLLASMVVRPANTSGKFLNMRRAMPLCCSAPRCVSSPSRPIASSRISFSLAIVAFPSGVSLPKLSALAKEK